MALLPPETFGASATPGTGAFRPLLPRRASGGDLPVGDLVIVAIESFDVEDDGSADWQYVIDLIAMLSAVLSGQELDICLETSVRTYLEGAVNILANDYAAADGKPISSREANRRLAKDPSWRQVVDFVMAL